MQQAFLRAVRISPARFGEESGRTKLVSREGQAYEKAAPPEAPGSSNAIDSRTFDKNLRNPVF